MCLMWFSHRDIWSARDMVTIITQYYSLLCPCLIIMIAIGTNETRCSDFLQIALVSHNCIVHSNCNKKLSDLNLVHSQNDIHYAVWKRNYQTSVITNVTQNNTGMYTKENLQRTFKNTKQQFGCKIRMVQLLITWYVSNN